MARIVNTLAGRLGVIVVIGQLLLLPALYVMLDWIVTRSHHERFVTEIRTYARLLADEFELGTATASDERTKALLDNVLLSGEGVFAELTLDGHVVRADLEGPGPKARFSAEDFEFGQGGDETYFLMVPIQHEKQEGELRIGFDEGPVTAQIERTRERILVALTLFFGVSVLASILLGYRFSRPLVALQRAARRVAAGTELARLDTDSDIAELQELARDLEFMRAELLKVNARLREEMRERGIAEDQRWRLEQRLAGRRRLETVGTLAGGIAHEFNNILVPIQLYTELAIEDLEEASPIRADLQRVHSAAQRARRIVSDFLLLTRRTDETSLKAVELGAIAAEIGDLFARASADGIEVVQEIQADCPPTLGEPAMLSQIIHNLCANACQAMAPAGGRLTIGARRASAQLVEAAGLAAGEHVEVYVSDTGHFDSESGAGTTFHVVLRVYQPAGEPSQ